MWRDAGVAQERHSRVNIWGYDLMRLQNLGLRKAVGQNRHVQDLHLNLSYRAVRMMNRLMHLDVEKPRKVVYASCGSRQLTHQGRRLLYRTKVKITMRRANSARGGAMYLSGQGLTRHPESASCLEWHKEPNVCGKLFPDWMSLTRGGVIGRRELVDMRS